MALSPFRRAAFNASAAGRLNRVRLFRVSERDALVGPVHRQLNDSHESRERRPRVYWTKVLAIDVVVDRTRIPRVLIQTELDTRPGRPTTSVTRRCHFDLRFVSVAIVGSDWCVDPYCPFRLSGSK